MKYLIMCEGPNELEVVKLLLENDCYTFTMDDLLVLAGDGTPVYTYARERKTRTCNCLEKGIRDCK